MKDEKPRDVTSADWYTTGNYGVQVVDEQKKPVLYTADGKPLGKSLRQIGFIQRKTS